MIKLCYKGTRKGLQVFDLYKTQPCNQSEQLTNTLQKHWNDELTKSKMKNHHPSLIRALVKTFFWKYMLCGVFLFLQMIFLRAFQPYVLAFFINLFSENQLDHDRLYIFGSILIVQCLLYVICMHHVDYGQASTGMRVRIAISSLVYRKVKIIDKKLSSNRTVLDVETK